MEYETAYKTGLSCTQTQLTQLLVLQKRALRLILFRNTREHAIPLFLIPLID